MRALTFLSQRFSSSNLSAPHQQSAGAGRTTKHAASATCVSSLELRVFLPPEQLPLAEPCLGGWQDTLFKGKALGHGAAALLVKHFIMCARAGVQDALFTAYTTVNFL